MLLKFWTASHGLQCTLDICAIDSVLTLTVSQRQADTMCDRVQITTDAVFQVLLVQYSICLVQLAVCFCCAHTVHPMLMCHCQLTILQAIS